MMKTNGVISFAVSLLVVVSGWAQSAREKMLEQQAAQFENRLCGVNPNRTLFRNMKREETVLFFVNHVPKKQTPLNEVLSTFKTKSARKTEVKEFVDSNYAMLRSLEDVAKTIGDRLIARKLNWLGIEKAADEITPEYEEELMKAAAAVEAQFKKDGIKPKEITSYLMLQMGPIYFSRWKNAQLRKATQVIPLDDVTIRMKTRAYVESKDAKATALLQAVPGSGIRTSDMEQIIDISQVSLFSGVKERTPELQALIAKIKKPAVKKLVEDYRVWIEQGVDSLSERDATTANLILAQKGMGLLLLSGNSGPGVSERLMNSCPNPAGGKGKR